MSILLTRSYNHLSYISEIKMFEKKTINAVLFMQNKASEGPIFEANWAIHTKCETRQSKTLWNHKDGDGDAPQHVLKL